MWHVSTFLFFIAFAALFTISGNEKVLLERVFCDEAYPQKAYADKLMQKISYKKKTLKV